MPALMGILAASRPGAEGDLRRLRGQGPEDYGAIQEAERTFCHVENGKDDCGKLKFIHVWRQTNGEWKLTRVISHGHDPS